MSEPVNRVSEQSERSEAEQSGALRSAAERVNGVSGAALEGSLPVSVVSQLLMSSLIGRLFGS